MIKHLHLYVHRKYHKEDYTVGIMYADTGSGFEKVCDTLEDVTRGLSQTLPLSKNKSLKVYGKTAIPTGTYDVGLYYWAKYRKNYPWLKSVPAFEGILIHYGATHKNTLGCILVGKNDTKGHLSDNGSSRKITNLVTQYLDMGAKVTITVSDKEPMIASNLSRGESNTIKPITLG